MSKSASTRVLDHGKIVDQLSSLTRDIDDPAKAARRWAAVLDGAHPFDSTIALVEGALSGEDRVRCVVAEALVWDVHVVGASIVLDYLARDANPNVRVAVARAAHARRRSLGDALLTRLTADPDERVSGAAAFALAMR